MFTSQATRGVPSRNWLDMQGTASLNRVVLPAIPGPMWTTRFNPLP